MTLECLLLNFPWEFGIKESNLKKPMLSFLTEKKTSLKDDLQAFLEGWLVFSFFLREKTAWGLTLKHRITGSVRLGKNSKVIEPSLTDPHCVNQTTALSATSGCSLDPSRDGDSTTFLPMFINPSKEEIPPGVQPELPPVQLRTISSCHVRMAQSQGYGHIDKGLGQS